MMFGQGIGEGWRWDEEEGEEMGGGGGGGKVHFGLPGIHEG